MNVVGTLCWGLTAALVLNPGLQAHASALPAAPAASSDDTTAPADTTAVDGNKPYASIVARNIFSLVPVPPPPPPAGPPEDPPPKITANGIMSVFGDLQALFKVSLPAKGGQPAVDQSYMLSEGQRQDDIEVVKIDVKAAIITFNNHGTEQEIPLEAAKDSGGGMATPTAGGPPPGGGFAPPSARFHPRPGMPPGGLTPGNPGFGGGNPGGAPGGNPFQPQNNNDNNGSPTTLPVAGGANNTGEPDIAQQAAQNTAGLTPEQQILLIEAERARLQAAQDAGQKPEYPPELLPPTSLTPQDGGSQVGGGSGINH